MDYMNGTGYAGGFNPYGNGGIPQQPYGNVTYQTPIKRENILPKETVESLRANVTNFTLGLTKEEIDRSACNHYYNGELMLKAVNDEPGVYQCSICGHRFVPKEGLTMEQLNDAVEGIIDILQTIKLMYVDAPEKAMIDYMTVIALLKKMPHLYKLAADNAAKYDGTMGTNHYNGNLNAFSILSNVLNGNMMQYNPYSGPVPQPGMGAPMGTPNPAQAAMLSGGGNGSTVYAPTTTGYSYSPGSMTNPAAPNSSNVLAENERLRRELEEAQKKLAATGGETVTTVAKMES